MMVTKIVVRQSRHPFPRPDTHKKNTPCRWLGVCSRWFTNMAQQFLCESGLSTSNRNWDTITTMRSPSNMDIQFCHEISRTQRNRTHGTLRRAAIVFMGKSRLASPDTWHINTQNSKIFAAHTKIKCAQSVLHVFHAPNSKNLDHLEGVLHVTGVAGICRTVGVGHCRHTKAATSAAVFGSAALTFQRQRWQNGVKHTPKQSNYGRDGACCVWDK